MYRLTQGTQKRTFVTRPEFDHDHPHRKPGPRQSVPSHRPGGRVASAHSYRRQAQQRGALVCGGLAGHPGDAASAFGSRHAGIHQGRDGRATERKRQGTRLVSWQVVFAGHAQKDAKKLAAAGLKPKAQALLAILAADPFQNPPPYEKLVGDLSGAYSRRINIQHRLVYEVFPAERIVRVLRMWTHYE